MRIVLIVLVFALTLYALLGYVRTPDESVPVRMPKYLRITLIVLFPTIGPITWITSSRIKAAEKRGSYVEPTVWSSKKGTTLRRPQRPRSMTSDDDPEFLRDLEQDVRRHKHHPQEYTDTLDASSDGTGEDPEADGTGGADRSRTNSH